MTFDKAIFRKLSDLRIGLMFFSDRISKLVALKATTEGAATVIGLAGGGGGWCYHCSKDCLLLWGVC